MAGGGISVSVDASGLAAASKTLREVARRTHTGLPPAVRQASEPLEAAVKREAASFSRRIPGAVRVQPGHESGGAAVQIVVDAAAAPHAAPINNRGEGGTFAHPVFGQGEATQQAHPFMHAAIAHAGEAEARMDRFADDVARQAGFR